MRVSGMERDNDKNGDDVSEPARKGEGDADADDVRERDTEGVVDIVGVIEGVAR